MSKIIENLCCWEDAKIIIPTLNNLLVINCTKDLEKLTANTHRISIDDQQKSEDTISLNKVIIEVIKIINNHLKNNGNVVVHCLAGRQRSAAVVACYLIKYHDMTEYQAIDYIKSIKSKKRDSFFSQVNFINTLKHWT